MKPANQIQQKRADERMTASLFTMHESEIAKGLMLNLNITDQCERADNNKYNASWGVAREPQSIAPSRNDR